MGVATVTFTLNLPAEFTEEDGWVIAAFPSLGVASQGRNKDEAVRNLIEAAQLFIESCFQRNQLDEALKECGFVPGHVAPGDQADHLTVPVELLAVRNGPASHAC